MPSVVVKRWPGKSEQSREVTSQPLRTGLVVSDRRTHNPYVYCTAVGRSALKNLADPGVRAGPRLQKVEPVSCPAALLSRLDEWIARVKLGCIQGSSTSPAGLYGLNFRGRRCSHVREPRTSHRAGASRSGDHTAAEADYLRFPVTFYSRLPLPCPGQGDMPQPLCCLHVLPNRMA